ncbi:MAG: excisionase family DNA-binding protein [Acidobacteria bacterium]|nr:excisionase family DNA-binding protein [Acidobacteriota bacterium]
MSNTGQLRTLRRLALSGSAMLVGKGGESVTIPASVRALLAEIALSMEAGQSVSLVADHNELNTQQAANALGVSRPFLVRMLKEGKLPFHMAGSHRRVYMRDLLAYKARRDRARHDAIKRMAREDVAAGTYDTVILPEGAERQ